MPDRSLRLLFLLSYVRLESKYHKVKHSKHPAIQLRENMRNPANSSLRETKIPAYQYTPPEGESGPCKATLAREAFEKLRPQLEGKSIEEDGTIEGVDLEGQGFKMVWEHPHGDGGYGEGWSLYYDGEVAALWDENEGWLY